VPSAPLRRGEDCVIEIALNKRLPEVSEKLAMRQLDFDLNG
jgi:hypothetical protein